MSKTYKLDKFFALLPTPFTIAVLITFVTFILALIFTKPQSAGNPESFITTCFILGKRNLAQPLLEFAIQMMLMLVLGML